MQLGFRLAPETVDERFRSEVTVASGLIEARERCGLDELALWARVAVGAQMSAVTALVGDDIHVVGTSGLSHAVHSRAASFCAYTIAEPSSLLCVPDARIDPRFASNPHVLGAPWVRFYAGAALMTAGGVPLGALCVIDRRPRTGLLAREVQVLTEIAAEVMRRVERGR